MISNIKEELDLVTERFLNIILSFSDEQLNIVTSPEVWSAAQVVQHVFLSDTCIQKTLKKEGLQAERRPDEMVKGIKDEFLNFDIKRQSPEEIVPERKYYDKEGLLTSLQESRKQMNEIIKAKDLTEICVDPIFGKITRLELLYFVIYHTERHLHQLKKMKEKVENGVEEI